MTVVYHLELRAFPSVARVFNLDREALDTRFVRPWTNGEMFEHEDRRWAPEKTKLTIIEGPPIDLGQVGMGRGWGEATKRGRNVTDTVLAEIQRGATARTEVEALKGAIAEVAGGAGSTGGPVTFSDAIALAVAAHPLWRASEQLAVAEQAVWEMLHQGRLEMLDDGEPVARERWQEIVLPWTTWTGRTSAAVRLHALTPPVPPGA